MLKVDINLVFTIVNLLILYVALRFTLFKPIQKIIDARQKEADQEFADAKEKQQAADDMKAQYEASLAGVEDEKKQILSDTRKKADEEYQKIVQDANDHADEIKKNAEKDGENKKAAIIKSAESEIANMVVDAAKKVVGTQSSSAADSALYDQFLNKAGE